ncbi:hypothetical protein FHX42_003721 [Saccharopolyspora lacisalsi]|uniref:Uncharacterized protein n=1 Tax=Halosaccharopolyspora lacisalsi TaxID=1000566 RepID=A0A839E3J9_9PSEU|nr:hypothetical protein [Halosaccharopolyspora lacisalsi]MBA8826345.1 hypothetical protein [Halosaccharopolyspora lacisalsi]
MLGKLSDAGVTSEMMFTAGFASIGASFVSWMVSAKGKKEALDRSDRWGIFIGEWAPTFFALGVGLRLEEDGRRGGVAKLASRMTG